MFGRPSSKDAAELPLVLAPSRLLGAEGEGAVWISGGNEAGDMVSA